MVAKKTAAQKAPAKKAAKGDGYECEVCGLAVTIDEVCDCIETCDIICYGEPMKARKIKVKAAAK
ncbi:MAG: hypothetical protein PHR56_01805 [Dehalococcoidales bacterium]|nr:hypothetical protein [Dehalococcoidales bacterium]